MKTKLLLILLLITLVISCQSYYGKNTYKKLRKELAENSQLQPKGYYYVEDSTYHYYNFKRKSHQSPGALIAQDSIKLIYYNFIVLYNDKTGYVDLTTRWNGINHTDYDSSTIASGNNTKDSAHAQFLKWANMNKLFNDKSEKSSFPAIYQIKNDSIFINCFQYVIDGKSTLYELKGPILDENTFEITNEKRYKTLMFGKERDFKTSLIFKFEELDKVK